MPVRVPVVAMVVAAGLTVGVVVASLLTSLVDLPQRPGAVAARAPAPATSTTSATSATPPTASPRSVAVAVLRDWDRRRAAAWARGDAASLRRLYTEGSPAGAADVALLRSYAARGLVVHGLSMQLLSVRLVVDRPARLELEVTDRLVGATAVRSSDSRAFALPADAASTRVLVIRRVDGCWLMDRVASTRP
jgi:hypothetical protein